MPEIDVRGPEGQAVAFRVYTHPDGSIRVVLEETPPPPKVLPDEYREKYYRLKDKYLALQAHYKQLYQQYHQDKGYDAE